MFKRLRSQLIFQHVDHKDGEAILDIVGLSARYDGNFALDNISFSINEAERIAVVGPNGAGKSTLFKVIAGVMEAAEGEVNVFGHSPGGHICIAYVPQRSQVDMNFPATVEDVVMMGRVGKIGFFKWPKKYDWEHVRDSLQKVGMDHLRDRQIGELSGGQQQRVFIAQALAQEADLILMDEPMNGLDATAREKIQDVLETLRAYRITVMVATHDLEYATQQFDRVLLLNKQILAFDRPERALTRDTLVAAYGDHMHVIEGGDEGQVMMIEDQCHDC